MKTHRATVAAGLRRWLPVWLILILIGGSWEVVARPNGPSRQSAGSQAAPASIGNVEAAFGRIQIRGEHLTARSNGLIPKPRYRTTISNFFGLRNHFQGIQRVPNSNYLVLSGSNTRTSELFVVRIGDQGPEGGDVVARIGVDTLMWHAGGLSVVGTTLAVPVHGGIPRHAKVVFYDFSEPERPRRLPVEIDRPGRKASATAMTRLPNGHFLVAVLSAYDGLPRRMDFYLSRGSALADGFLPQPATWHVSEVQTRAGQEKTFSFFQGINFIQQADGRLFLVGFHNSFLAPSILPGRDYADLYEVVFPGDTIEAPAPVLTTPSVVKIANRMLRCTGGYCNLDAAAGLFVDPEAQSLSIYATPGWLDGDTVKVTVYPGGGRR